MPLVHTEREANIPLLILFLVVAIPITIVLMAVLLTLIIVSLGLAVGLVALGAVQIVAAFSGFAVLADILVLLGAAVVTLALGLLFLWFSIWLIGSVVIDLFRWEKNLAETWCYKEVPAE